MSEAVDWVKVFDGGRAMARACHSIAWKAKDHGPWVDFVFVLLLLTGNDPGWRTCSWPVDGVAIDWTK